MDVCFWTRKNMCLAVPVRVIQVEETGTGAVDYFGTEIRASFALLPRIKTGDWVIVHAGFAISKLSSKEARETLKLIKEMGKTQAD